MDITSKDILQKIDIDIYKIIRINLTKNTYERLHLDAALDDITDTDTGDIGNLEMLNEGLLKCNRIHPNDLPDYREYINVSFVSEYMKKYHGKQLIRMNVRYMFENTYKLINLVIAADNEYTDDNQSIFVVIRNADSSFNKDYVHFEELLRGLGENYGAIYYVDFDNDTVRPFRMNDAIEKAFGAYFRTCPTYRSAMDGYIERVVFEPDKDMMRRITQYDYLKEALRDILSFSHEYRVFRDGKEMIFRFKIANLDGVGELHRAVCGFADISNEKTLSKDDYKIGKKVLIVDDDRTSRRQLCNILSSKFETIEADNGKHALEILGHSYREVAVIITDVMMPEMDGYEFLRQVKKNRQYSSIPVIVSTAMSEHIEGDRLKTEIKVIKLGALDVILKPYISDIVINRIQAITKLRETTLMLDNLETDSLTGLYSKEFFFQHVERHLREHPDEDYIMWVSDINGLKIINEKYGLELGDETIVKLANGRENIKCFIMGGRIEGDKLAALTYAKDFDDVLKWSKKHDLGIRFPVPNVVVKNGFYRIERNSSIPAQGMYDRALLAIQKIKSVYGVYMAEYNDEIRKNLLIQRQVSENAENALESKQFSVYYQPKYNIEKNRTDGAEALIRWIHPEFGFMNPGIFIPQFEQSGFIRQLDFYVWEEVCKSLKEWKEKGMRLVPVSVNMSRRDFENPDLAEQVIALVDKYEVDHSLFHVEVTESAYTDNPNLITDIIKKFHDSGFMVELDDFGTGYSSMTALSNLDLDIMKLDMSIIQNDDPSSDKSVLEFSMQLAKMMKLKTVAEGVETEEQVHRIAQLGGNYIQGYYYSKPLPKDQFEEYIRNEK